MGKPAPKLDAQQSPSEEEAQKRLAVVVEDSFPNRKILTKLLTEMDFRVVEASNGNDAINQINEILQKKLAIDLIVSDVMMPKLDGFMMVERVRAHAEMQKVPVIFITALKTREHIVRAQELKANGYLIKPIISDHFYAKLLQIFPDLNNKVSSLQLRVGKL